MSTQAPESITVELGSGDPINGTVRDQWGELHPFYGWLELCSTIDQAWQAAKAEGEAAAPEEGGEA